MDIALNKKIVFVGIGILLTSFLITQFKASDNLNVPMLIKDVIVNPPTIINSLNLIDHNNKKVNLESLVNNWTFIFFGYTNCPDVCPATLSQLVQVNKTILSSKNSKVNTQYFFVSIDPERDTIKHLADYIKYFDSDSNKNIFGITGIEKNLMQFEQQLGAFHKIDKEVNKKNYRVQHSAEIFLINPAGQLTAKFLPPMDVKKVVKQFELFVKNYTNTVT